MKLPRIQAVLTANWVFCLFSTALILLFTGTVIEYLIDLPRPVFVVLSLVLVLFALYVFLTARHSEPGRARILVIFVADLAWVVMTPVVMLVLQDRITPLGNLVLVGIVLLVAAFAVLEWLAAGAAGAPQGRH
ncbi:MAG: hypothetical protein R3F41_20350 [Gammaproteobacteria bacterium]|nr:hypothetical protein [Pseudomonadales bacterium]MCP5346499.1 hypothetical protein [Pseudomonadales bacterium]